MKIDVEKIVKDLEDFFGIKAPEYKIILLNSREEYDRVCGRKTEDWQAGVAKGSTIYAIHPDKLEEITTHKKESHPTRIKHEMVHLFYRKCANGEGRPRWLNEGLACYLASKKQWTLSDDAKLAATDYFSVSDKNIYGIGEFTVRTLVEKYGEERLIKIIKKIHPPLTEEGFGSIFKKIYGFNFSKGELKKIIE